MKLEICEHLKTVKLELNLLVLIQKKIVLQYCIDI